jgi:sulfoxide reductase catalytic subunit YedY
MVRRFSIPAIASSEITPEPVYLRRRAFLRSVALAAAPAALSMAPATAVGREALRELRFRPAQPGGQGFFTAETKTPFADVSGYCNFYEFGTDKSDPARYAGEMTIDPWSIEVDGLVARPGKLHLEDILGSFDLE